MIKFDSDFSARTDTRGTAMPVWPQLRRLLIFQLKLYIDALRDFLLSLLSIGAFILDVISNSHGPDSYFEGVLKLGRRSERAINLFDQFNNEEGGGSRVDDIIEDVESRFRNKRGRP